MKSKKFQKILSVLVSVSLTLSAISGSLLTVNATDSPPMTGVEAMKDNQPGFNGYRVWDIRDWSPEEDPGSEFLKADIPLQTRIDPFKPTQANPDLESDAEIMLMQGDYGNSFSDGMMYNNTFSYHTLNFWQYADYWSPWHGAMGPHTPKELYNWDVESGDANGWQKRYFEFGVLNIPNPAYTNAAHRNGVQSIACIYFDQNFRLGQTINELFVQDEDGTFPVAEKLIEMAEYFGYDGYFFNAEEEVWTENQMTKRLFLKTLEDAGLYTQYYNQNSTMGASKAEWLEYDVDGDGVKEKLQDSVFVNYQSFTPSSVDAQIKFIEDNGYDAFKQVFFGVEAMKGFSEGHTSLTNFPNLYAPGTKNPRGSIALFTPSDYYQRELPGDEINNPDYQWKIAERERMFFSGAVSNPLDTGKKPNFSRPDVGYNRIQNWVGAADFTSERSVIDGTTFYSSFNTGKGRQYFTDGKITNEEDWSNINIQSILPSWQWWFETPDQTKSKMTYNFVSPDGELEGSLDTDIATEANDTVAKKSTKKSNNVITPLATEVATSAKITISQPANGKIAIDAADLDQVPIGSTVKITATPNEGYVLAPRSVKVNGEVNTVMSFKMPAADVTIEAKFKLPAHDSLTADFDFGDKYFTGAYDYEKIGGYNGGSSLVLSGGLEARNTLRLFKTELNVTENSKLDLTYFKPSKNDGSELSIGLIFKDSPSKMEVISIPGTGTKTSKWTTKQLDLSRYAGKDIATIALGVNPKQGAVADYQVNIGEIKLTDGTDHTPSQPTGFKVDRMFTDDELIVKWDIGNFDDVDNYEIYAELSDGTELHCGGIFSDIFYIKTLLEENDVATLKLYAIGKDGSRSTPATIDFNFSNKVSNVKVAEETITVIPRVEIQQVKGTIKQSDTFGALNVSWTNPKEAYKELEITVTMDDSKDEETEIVKTVAKGVTSTQVVLPKAHGEKYNVAIRTVSEDETKSEAINVTGKVKDVYVEPYDVSTIRIKGNSATFMCPDPTDWLRMHATVNGKKLTFRNPWSGTVDRAIRAGTRLDTTLPSTSGKIEVILEDYAGNFSEPAYRYYYDNPDAEITNVMFPDAVLFEAVKAQAGTTVKQVTEFNGTLNLAGLNISDFTGISSLANVKTIDFTGSTINEIVKGTISTNAEKLILKNSTALTAIKSLDSMPKLKELDITGCSNLEILNISDSNLEKLTYGETSSFAKLVSVNMSNAKFDMSEGTPEKTFADAIALQAQGKDDIISKGTEEINISEGKTVNPDTTTVAVNTANKLFDGNLSYFTLPKTYPSYVGISFDEAVEISSWKMFNDTYSTYGLKDFEIQYSTDASTWKTLGTAVTGSTAREVAQSIVNPVSAKHYRLMYTAPQPSGPDVRELQLFICPDLIFSAGVKYDGQKPEITTIVPATADVKQAQGNINAALLVAGKTVRGTDAKSLIDKDFIADDYSIVDQLVDSNSILVEVADSGGNVNLNTIDTAKSAIYTVTLTSFKTSASDGEELGTMTVKVGDGGIIIPSVDSVTVSPKTASVKLGETKQFNAEIKVTNDASKDVAWSVTGAENPETKIDANGLLTVGAEETSVSLTVKATSAVDSTKFDTAIVTVLGGSQDSSIQSVTVSPKTVSLKYGDKRQFNVTVEVKDNASKAVKWSVSGAENSETKISNLGALSIGPKETSTKLIVKATSEVDPTKYDTATVTVTPYKAPSGGGSSSGGYSGGGSSTPAPSAPIVVEKNNKTEVTVKEPETTVVGNKAEVTIPTIDISSASASKPIEITVNVPSDTVVDLIKNNTGSQVIIDVTIPSALFNTTNVSVKDINVDKAIFKQAKESGKQVVINIKDTSGKVVAEWTFDGKNVTNILDTNLSFTIKNSNSLPSISKTFGNNANAVVVSFNHSGLLPGIASVELDVSKNFNSGDTLSLYYNNTATGKLDKVSDGIVVDANGKATVKISHCSDYVLVKTASASTNVPTVVAPSTNPQTGDSWWRCLFA